MFTNDTEQTGQTGYNIDLGSQHGFVEHNIDKMNHINGTKNNVSQTHHDERVQMKLANKTKDHALNPHHNITHEGMAHTNQTHHHGNLTTNHHEVNNNTNLRQRGKVPKPSIGKKSNIPHPGVVQVGFGE